MAPKQLMSATRAWGKPGPASVSPPATKPVAKKKPKPPTTKRSSSKVQSEAALKRLKTTDDLEEAKSLATFIVQAYNGSHLYPLSAITMLACFPDTFNTAVDFIFESLQKVCQRLGKDPEKLWKDIDDSSGAAGRCFKNHDEKLAQVVCTEWARLSEEGRETELKSGALYDRILAFWRRLVQTFHAHSPSFSTPQWHRPDILQTSFVLCKLIERRRLAVLKVNRLVGQVLPLELANIIKDQIQPGEELLKVAKMCSLTADDTHIMRAKAVCIYDTCQQMLQEEDTQLYNSVHSWLGRCISRCCSLFPYHKVTKLHVGDRYLVVWKRSARDAYEKSLKAK